MEATSKTRELTVTFHYLDSHPKFFCIIGASIFGLQARSIQQIFPWSRKFQRQFSHFLLYPAEYLTDTFMNQEPWRTILPLGKFISPLSGVLHVQFMQQSMQVQFLVQMTYKLHKEPLWCPSSSWSSLMLPGSDVSHCHKKS